MAPAGRSSDTSGSEPPDEWDDPTPVESTQDTPTRDLSGVARISAARSRDDVVRLAYGEGQEDAVRALYAVMRAAARPLTRAEMDHIVLAVRQRFTRL